ncbi:hypothetical protein HDU80_009992, partial [Chytriomyces hyalinus]
PPLSTSDVELIIELALAAQKAKFDADMAALHARQSTLRRELAALKSSLVPEIRLQIVEFVTGLAD